MSDRLPPLTALRAFEAAARHLSFARAADELNVTPAALSFQIKSLESHLGQPVFHRLTRAVALTEAGARLQPGVADGFAALHSAWAAAGRVQDENVLTVTAGPAFTSTWLAPRMYDFAQAHPEVELRLLATLRLADLVRDGVDVAIRYGVAAPPGMHSTDLTTDWLTPMMAPHLARQVTQPSDLLRFPLARQEDTLQLEPMMNWPAYLKAVGVTDAPTPGPSFSHADHASNAAIAGACIILGRVTLTAPALRDGHLVAPLKDTFATRSRFRFLCVPGTEDRPPIRAFLTWLRAELAQIENLTAHRTIHPATP
ncbi:transcriptional regulator GcvA [Meridianimarinicoccus sp. MJW13]|uniref:transcriptional regulator GcvA n=1 Tax=Meridianimarinicoccus sp. MJW13 TaxID=2720031 RepID=UPI001866CE13|nr:transcriptional regulator GcvA [Fluviibacterium sp. MJW13]